MSEAVISAVCTAGGALFAPAVKVMVCDCSTSCTLVDTCTVTGTVTAGHGVLGSHVNVTEPVCEPVKLRRSPPR